MKINYNKLIDLIYFNKKKAPVSSYTVPYSSTNFTSNSNTSCLLLNTEFTSNTNLYGFDLYAVTSGSITLQVKILNLIYFSKISKLIIQLVS